MKGDSAFRHPDPGQDMPVPRDMATTPTGPHERMSEAEVNKALAKTWPKHEDNRGMDPASGGTREVQP